MSAGSGKILRVINTSCKMGQSKENHLVGIAADLRYAGAVRVHFRVQVLGGNPLLRQTRWSLSRLLSLRWHRFWLGDNFCRRRRGLLGSLFWGFGSKKRVGVRVNMNGTRAYALTEEKALTGRGPSLARCSFFLVGTSVVATEMVVLSWQRAFQKKRLHPYSR